MRLINCTVILFSLVLLGVVHYAEAKQETLLDYTPQISEDVLLEIPQIPRYCDNMKAEKKYVDIGDCKLYCEIEGKGTPLVLVHGGPGGTHHMFHPWLTDLAKNFQVIYYDQRGCGLSDYNPGEGYSFEQTADDLEKLKAALDIEKWIVCGYSMGGGIAQYYTVKYPESVIGQILIGGIPMISNSELTVSRLNKFQTEQELTKRQELVTLYTSGKISYSQYLYNKDLNGGWKRGGFSKPSPERTAQMALYDMVKDENFTSDYYIYKLDNVFLNCPVPTLFCEGKYDLNWTEEKPKIMQTYHPRAQFTIFENSGHSIFSDETDKLFQVIKDWLKSLKAVDKNSIADWKSETGKLLKSQIELISSNKAFVLKIKEEGVISAETYYKKAKEKNPEQKIFFEDSMNALGYDFLLNNKTEEAIVIFSLMVTEYPDSWNAFDSLGEAYLVHGDKDRARLNYEKSLELNPKNENGRKVLAEMK